MRTLVVTLTFAIFALASAPAADAQAPNAAPSLTVAITGLPAEFPGLVSNATPEVSFSVDVSLRNVVCPQATTIPVTISASAGGAPAFFQVAVDPETGEVAVPQGQYASTPASGSVPATLKATLGEITANASVPVEVTATAAPPAGCQGTGTLSPAEAKATILANMTAPPPPPPPTPEDNDSPGPGAVLGVLAAFAAAALRRRPA